MVSITSLRGHSFDETKISQSSTVVDLGANLGDFSVQISTEYNCPVYAVEASPDIYHKIPNSELIHKFNYAISDTDAPVSLYISQSCEANTLNPVAKGKWCNEGLVTIQGITLHSLMIRHQIRSIDLLKVDIEGAELRLFNSLTDEFISEIPQITVEFHDFIEDFDCAEEVMQIKRRLKKLGYLCLVVSRPLNVDVLFLNQKKCDISWVEYYSLLLKYDYIPYIVRFVNSNLMKISRLPAKIISLLKLN